MGDIDPSYDITRRNVASDRILEEQLEELRKRKRKEKKRQKKEERKESAPLDLDSDGDDDGSKKRRRKSGEGKHRRHKDKGKGIDTKLHRFHSDVAVNNGKGKDGDLRKSATEEDSTSAPSSAQNSWYQSPVSDPKFSKSPITDTPKKKGRADAKIKTSPKDTTRVEDSDEDVVVVGSSPSMPKSTTDDAVEDEDGANDPGAEAEDYEFVRRAEERMNAARTGPADSADPVIRIYVTSRIEGTVPMLAKRRISQELGLVRKTYCQYQRNKGFDMPEEADENVFLTWKSNKIYNSSTCLSLGIKPDSQGHLHKGPRHRKPGFSGWDMLHFEAWTEEAWAQHVQEAEGGEKEDDVIVEAEVVRKFKVYLKAKGAKDVKVTARSDMTVDDVIARYRAKTDTPDEWQISLIFDGDTLDPESTLGDADIEHEDALDVHVKKGGGDD